MLQFGELPAALKSVATQPLLVIARTRPKLDAGEQVDRSIAFSRWLSAIVFRGPWSTVFLRCFELQTAKCRQQVTVFRFKDMKSPDG